MSDGEAAKVTSLLPVDEAQFIELLHARPDFFVRHPHLLEMLELPHVTGRAVSLIERQVAVLRDRNRELRHRLDHLLESARTNDQLFDKTRRAVLALLDAGDLAAALDSLHHSLAQDFEVEFHSLVLFATGKLAIRGPTRVAGIDAAPRQISALLRNQRTICGVLRDADLTFLFGDAAARIGSVGVVPIGPHPALGVLAIGHADANHYRSSTGTLFLDYLADVLGRILPRLLAAAG